MEDKTDPSTENCHTYLEYHGGAGTTEMCSEAVERILQCGRPLRHALILTAYQPSNSRHALLLTDNDGGRTIIKAGFSSGYGGTGPSSFSKTLALLHWHFVTLDETLVNGDIIDRLDASALTNSDLTIIDESKWVKPSQLWKYIRDDDLPTARSNPWRYRAPLIPFSIFEGRLAAAARDFWIDPDSALFKAHRQLEEAIRIKANISSEEAQSGPAKIYATAFNKPWRLTWPGLNASEHAGRANLFLGVLLAYRHPRAHRDINDTPYQQLRELLLINHLFQLEAEAISIQDKS